MPMLAWPNTSATTFGWTPAWRARAADGLLVAEYVVVVAGDEGVVAGHAVGGEVLDAGDLVAVAGQLRRVVLVQPAALELGGEDDLAEGEVGGSVVVVGEPVGAFHAGVAEPPGSGDAADDRLLAEPCQVELGLVERGGLLVDGERFGDPRADPALVGEVDELDDLGAARLGLGGVDDAGGVDGESHGEPSVP
jgi:hypothetical protein